MKFNPKNMIHETIEKIIPYVMDNFITYPLWEEGKYIPYLNFWQKFENKYESMAFYFKVNEVLKDKDYDIYFTDNSRNIHFMQMYPDYIENDDGGFEYVNKNWSIEEMVNLLAMIIKQTEEELKKTPESITKPHLKLTS